MNIRFVTRNVHAFLDYPVAAALMGLPFILGLGQSTPVALWLSVATGVAALTLTVLTNHRTGLIRVIPYKIHVLVDAAVGATFLAAPFIFNFTGIDAWYYWLNGAAVATVVALHKTTPDDAPTTQRTAA